MEVKIKKGFSLEDLDNKVFLGITYLMVLIIFYFLFNFTGVKLFIGLTLLYFIPIYYILGLLNINQFERIIFSFFIGLGVVPSLVYYLAQLFSSMRTSIVVSFFLLITTGIILTIYKKRNRK